MEPGMLLRFPIEAGDALPRKMVTRHIDIFAPMGQMRNPERKWWQFWKPKMVLDPKFWDRLLTPDSIEVQDPRSTPMPENGLEVTFDFDEYADHLAFEGDPSPKDEEGKPVYGLMNRPKE